MHVPVARGAAAELLDLRLDGLLEHLLGAAASELIEELSAFELLAEVGNLAPKASRTLPATPPAAEKVAFKRKIQGRARAELLPYLCLEL
jgi:hypothetical protein